MGDFVPPTAGSVPPTETADAPRQGGPHHARLHPRPRPRVRRLAGHLVCLRVRPRQFVQPVRPQITALTAGNANWQALYATSNPAQAAARAAVSDKNGGRGDYETLIRQATALIQAFPGTTDADRQAMGITVRGGPHTHVAALPTTPVLSVDMGTRLVHVVEFADSGAPTSKAKPAGVMVCELWHKIGGPAPVSNKGMAFLAVDTRTPYTINFDAADVGQTVYYLGRWVTSQGEQGPWSTVIGATVGG